MFTDKLFRHYFVTVQTPVQQTLQFCFNFLDVIMLIYEGNFIFLSMLWPYPRDLFVCFRRTNSASARDKYVMEGHFLSTWK